MKNIKYIVALILFIVFPVTINAATASISNVKIDGGDTATVGSEFIQGFNIQFSGIKKGTSDTLGIWLVAFELEYDENVFIIEKTSSSFDVWASTVYKENGKTYVISQFNKTSDSNACVDRVLYCADHYITINFYVKDTYQSSTMIKLKEVGAGVFQVSGALNPEYNTSDMIELEYNKTISKKITIKKPENATVNEPKSIVSSSKPTTKKTVTSKAKTITNTTPEKSSNNYLKSLKISGYPISFTKDNNKYNITVDLSVNALKIGAKAEDEKATIEVIGADDLDLNDNTVFVKVTAENGDENVYTITVNKVKIEETKEKSFKFTKKHLIIGGIILGSIIFILITISIIVHIKDRKIDKALDKM